MLLRPGTSPETQTAHPFSKSKHFTSFGNLVPTIQCSEEIISIQARVPLLTGNGSGGTNLLTLFTFSAF